MPRLGPQKVIAPPAWLPGGFKFDLTLLATEKESRPPSMAAVDVSSPALFPLEDVQKASTLDVAQSQAVQVICCDSHFSGPNSSGRMLLMDTTADQ